MQYWVMQFMCALLVLTTTTKCIYARPQSGPVYNYADKAIAGGSPVEDHSEHLSGVANAYHGTDQIYNNYPNANTLQRIPAVQQGNPMEHAIKETEHYDSRILSFYENKHKAVNDKVERKPIIDKIQEHEKYGNTGDQFRILTQPWVLGIQAIANVINRSITKTDNVVTGGSKKLVEQLDQVGASIVGL